MNTRLRLQFFIFALLAAPLVAAQTYYKWTDDNGTVHFTQEPPADSDYEIINTSGQVTGTSPSPQNAPPPLGEASGAESAEEVQMPREAEPDPELLKARCRQAHENMFWLQNKRRVIIEDDDGNETFASAEKQLEMMEENQALIDEWCQDVDLDQDIEQELR